MSFVPIRKQDLSVGGPLPWAVYDRQKNLLLRDGYVLESEVQLNQLVEQGLFRRASGGELAGAERNGAAPAAEAAKESAQKEVPFDEVKLQIGDPLQLQPMVDGEETRYYVKLIGFQKGQAVLVTTPVVDGMTLLMKEGKTFVVRAFSGKSAFAFTASVLKATNTPFPHLFLAYPRCVRGLVVRKGTRVRTRVIAAATRPQDAPGESVAVTIVNISTSGAMLTARAPLGKKGDTLAIKFKLSLNDIESYLDIETVLRNVEAGAATEQGAAQWQHGVEFREVAQQDLLMLTAYIYQKLLDESASGQ